MKLILYLITILVCASAGTAYAQVWSNAGLSGKHVNGLKGGDDSVNVLYAAVDSSGIWRMDKNGTWNPFNIGIPPGANGLAVGTVAGQLVAWTSVGVYSYSTALGSWVSENTTMPIDSTKIMAFAPIDQAGSNGWMICGDTNRIWAFTDKTWSLSPPIGTNDVKVRQIAYGPDSVVYAATEDNGVYAFSKAGSWSGYDQGAILSTVTCMNLNSNGTKYFGTRYGGVYRNRGGKWDTLTAGIPVVFGFLIKSQALVQRTGADSMVALATDGGVFRLIGDVAWERLATGLSGYTADVASLVYVGKDLYAGTYGGVMRITPGGSGVALNAQEQNTTAITGVIPLEEGGVLVRYNALPGKPLKLQVSDVQGRIVFTYNQPDPDNITNQAQISLPGSGFYILRLQSGAQVSTRTIALTR